MADGTAPYCKRCLRSVILSSVCRATELSGTSFRPQPERCARRPPEDHFYPLSCCRTKSSRCKENMASRMAIALLFVTLLCGGQAFAGTPDRPTSLACVAPVIRTRQLDKPAILFRHEGRVSMAECRRGAYFCFSAGVCQSSFAQVTTLSPLYLAVPAVKLTSGLQGPSSAEKCYSRPLQLRQLLRRLMPLTLPLKRLPRPRL